MRIISVRKIKIFIDENSRIDVREKECSCPTSFLKGICFHLQDIKIYSSKIGKLLLTVNPEEIPNNKKRWKPSIVNEALFPDSKMRKKAKLD